MRLNECEQVKETLDKHLGINLTVVDGSELFLGRLAGVTEPEAKRKIIGGTCETISCKLARLPY
jgi:GMP synthase (glutamine-hydrolysing)